MSDLPAARRLGANLVASEFQRLRSEQRTALMRGCPDFYFAVVRFNARFVAAKG